MNGIDLHLTAETYILRIRQRTPPTLGFLSVLCEQKAGNVPIFHHGVSI